MNVVLTACGNIASLFCEIMKPKEENSYLAGWEKVNEKDEVSEETLPFTSSYFSGTNILGLQYAYQYEYCVAHFFQSFIFMVYNFYYVF